MKFGQILTKMNESILKNFEKHISLDPAEIEYVQSLLSTKEIRKNTVLLKTGDLSRHIYFVSKGCLRMYNTDDKGQQHVVSFSPEGWWAVDLSSFHTRNPAIYTIDALEDTEVLFLSNESLEALYEKVPKFERFFRIFFANGLVLYQRRMTEIISQPAEERYLQFRKRYPGLEQRIAQKHIAAYLGITPVFLSMLRKRL